MTSMTLLRQAAADVHWENAAAIVAWCRDAVRLAITALNDETDRRKTIRLPPLGEAWLRQLEEESFKHLADS